jgi:hypothetical protein
MFYCKSRKNLGGRLLIKARHVKDLDIRPLGGILEA